MFHRSRRLRCSFCARPEQGVSRLIAGPGVYICDECVALCNRILAQPPSAPPSVAGTAARTRGRRGRGAWWRRFLPQRRGLAPVGGAL
jgi:hypothetical protein